MKTLNLTDRWLTGLYATGINPSQIRFLLRPTETEKNTDMSIGIRTEDSSVQTGEDTSHLKLHSQCERPPTSFLSPVDSSFQCIIYRVYL
jgi:hypothetical protein